MSENALETWAIGTSTLVVIVLGVILIDYGTQGIIQILPEVDTPTAALLFGYLWLLTIVAASQIELSRLWERDTATVLTDATVGGAVVALVYLTVVLIVGFVAPVPSQLDPGSMPVLRVVATGTVVGAVAGCAFVLLFAACDRIATAVVANTHE